MVLFEYNTNTKHYCGACGRQMSMGASSEGGYYYCNHGKGVTGTMAVYTAMGSGGSEPMSNKQRDKLFLIDRRNEEIQRAWKRDQYAKVNCKMRI